MDIKEIEINGLRGIAEGELKNFNKLNILVGKNNTGKSTVLEAIYLGLTLPFRDILGVNPIDYILWRRGWTGLDSVSKLFYRDKRIFSINIRSVIEHAKKITVVLEESLAREDVTDLRSSGLDVDHAFLLSIRVMDKYKGEVRYYIDEKSRSRVISKIEEKNNIKVDILRSALLIDWHRVLYYGIPEEIYALMMEKGGLNSKEYVISVLSEKYRSISDIAPLKMRNNWVLYVIGKNYSLPYYSMGDGFRNALVYLMILASAYNIILLLEEPELHQHPGLLDITARAIVKSIAERKLQVFISSHSLELIDLIAKYMEEKGLIDKLNLYRLMLDNGILKSTIYSGQEVIEARRELEYDLRG